MNSEYHWDSQFCELFDRCCERYRNGEKDYSLYYEDADSSFLASIGYRPREFFDFVEDFCDEGAPSRESALLVASARRDYFLVVMDKAMGQQTLMPEDLPGRSAELGGHPWLPRIIAKARAKLRGELDPDIMYCCGGDRAFLDRHDIHPADFLRVVWAAGEDDDKIASYLNSRGA